MDRFYLKLLIVISVAKMSLVVSSKNHDTEEQPQEHNHSHKRIAIIGGGISGSFTSNYLSQYDKNLCLLDSVTIFEPFSSLSSSYPSLASESDATKAATVESNYFQGSRVESVKLSGEDIIVETGASIAFSGNLLLKEVIDSDLNLEYAPPHHVKPTKENTTQTDNSDSPQGLGIWNGQKFLLTTSSSAKPAWLKKLQLLLRYNTDLIKLKKAVQNALISFDKVYNEILSDKEILIQSPEELWSRVGLFKPTLVSFDDFLDILGISKGDTDTILSSFLPAAFQIGTLRKELLTAINLCNYNQLNSQLNGLVGLVSFVPSSGELFSVLGGNKQLTYSAFQQAKTRRAGDSHCLKDLKQKDGHDVYKHVQRKVTTIVSDSEKFELWSEGDKDGNKEKIHLGDFDVVILACPLQQSRIQFYIKSHFDGAVLHPMPLNGFINRYDAHDNDDITSDVKIIEDNESSLRHEPPPLPKCEERKYTQVITTILSNATINYTHFGFSSSMEKDFPKSIYVTEQGFEKEHIQSITQLTPFSESKGAVFKMFSSDKVSQETLTKLFHPGFHVEYEKVWGGSHGGATPAYAGGFLKNSLDDSQSHSQHVQHTLPFLLYDGGTNLSHDVDSNPGPALYYINSIESYVSSMEISAIGAKLVSKLVAKRLGLFADDFLDRSKDRAYEEL